MQVSVERAWWDIQYLAWNHRHNTSVYGTLPYPVVNYMSWLEVSYIEHGARDDATLSYMLLLTESENN